MQSKSGSEATNGTLGSPHCSACAFSAQSEKSELGSNATGGAATTIWPLAPHLAPHPSSHSLMGVSPINRHMGTYVQHALTGEGAASTEHHVYSPEPTVWVGLERIQLQSSGAETESDACFDTDGILLFDKRGQSAQTAVQDLLQKRKVTSFVFVFKSRTF